MTLIHASIDNIVPLIFSLIGDIAIDDLDVTPGACSNLPPLSDPVGANILPISCSFDSSVLCNGWYNKNWTISNYTTPSANTGPQVEHTGE